MKEFVKLFVPPILIALIKKFKPPVATKEKTDPLKIKLEEEFRLKNQQLPADTMIFRDNLMIKLHPDSRLPFEYFCFRSTIMVEEMDAFLKYSENKYNKRLLDIGALHGLFSLVFVSQGPEKSAIAIDASPLAFSRLLYNVYKNKHEQIDTIECAISDREGVLPMHYEWEHAVAAGTTDKTDNIVFVPMVTGDIICQSRAFVPDIIKIDVEGHEVKVLKGLHKTISNARPTIFLEVHPNRIAQEGILISELEQMFSAWNYQAQTVSGEIFPLASFSTLRDDARLIMTPKK
jgi:FkbM family methyltransferase